MKSKKKKEMKEMTKKEKEDAGEREEECINFATVLAFYLMWHTNSSTS